MGIISVLPSEVVAQIAAGEVVERPAYAIKELIENSIDAGATRISIEIRDGGISWFRVTDNGQGIRPEDIKLAFERHATSKIEKVDDLFKISTLGFRGEALASIAAVSHLEVRTRSEHFDSGIIASLDGGVFQEIRDIASPTGTTITVRDLFYNVPARKKFLKKPANESSLVSEIVVRQILARPDISFRFLSDGHIVYKSPGSNSLYESMYSIWENSFKTDRNAFVPVHGSAAGCVIDGYVGIGSAARATRSNQIFVLNGRCIQNKMLSAMLDDACREKVMIGKHPVCALHLTMPYDAVDVNVHPNKLEVRFQDERALSYGISQVIRQSFPKSPIQAAPQLYLHDSSVPTYQPMIESSFPKDQLSDNLDIIQPVPKNKPSVCLREPAVAPPLASLIKEEICIPDATPITETLIPSNNNDLQLSQENSDTVQFQTVDKTDHSSVNTVYSQGTLEDMGLDFSSIQVSCVLWNEYIVVSGANTLYLIDQHAAHERILYDKMCQSMQMQQTISQPLLLPQIMELSYKDYIDAINQLDLLRQSGFDIEDFGNRTICVRAVPMILGTANLQSFISDFSECLQEMRAIPSEEKKRDMLIKFACKKAVKAGDRLPESDIYELVQKCIKNAAPTCPHGRPIIVALDKAEIDKRFRRII